MEATSLGERNNSHKVMQELKGRRVEGGRRRGAGGCKHQEVHEGESEILMLIHCCPALNITKR